MRLNNFLKKILLLVRMVFASIFKEKIRLRGRIRMVLRGPDGIIKDERCVENLIVTAGKTESLKLMVGVAASPFDYIAIGTGTTAAAAGNTALESELIRQQDGSTGVSGTDATIDTTFAAGDGTGAITEAGILNEAVAGDLLCRQVFSVINKAAGDSLAVTWTVSMS